MKRIFCFTYILFVLFALSGCAIFQQAPIDKIDGNYTGVLIFEEESISSWVPSVEVEIINNQLFWEQIEEGEFVKGTVDDHFWGYSHLVIVAGYDDIINQLKNMKQCLSIEVESGDIGYHLFELEGKFYIVLALYTYEMGYHSIKGYELNEQDALTGFRRSLQ
ncbi:MAG: hypothetical protein WC182_03740 [Bacilli bacterium]